MSVMSDQQLLCDLLELAQRHAGLTVKFWVTDTKMGFFATNIPPKTKNLRPSLCLDPINANV